jgi:hypothetical protein
MRRRTHSVRSYVDLLEARELPAGNLTVTFSAVTHTLTVVGDANADNVTVKGDAISQTNFLLTSSGTINGLASPFPTPTGVKNLVFKMLGGVASVTFDPTIPITVQGSVTFNGGTGQNSVTATQLTVGKNLSITNKASVVDDLVTLTNFSAGGNVTIRNGGGNTLTQIVRDSAGLSTIRGNMTVTNGTGQDSFYLNDTNVDGNVTINNGHGDAGGHAGLVNIFNQYNSAFRSIIGGNLTVTYLDGNTADYDGLFDTEVLGNVTYNHGTGAFTTYMDGFNTKLPVLIHGNLTITGTGANSLGFGTVASRTGLIVGNRFTLTSGGGTAETLSFRNFQVGGDTSIRLGDGGNMVTIDDSYFGGRFTLVSSSGNDTFNVETTAGTSSATEFRKAVLVDFGTGTGQFNIAANGPIPDGGQVVIAYGTFVLKSLHGGFVYGDAVFPNGGSIHV